MSKMSTTKHFDRIVFYVHTLLPNPTWRRSTQYYQRNQPTTGNICISWSCCCRIESIQTPNDLGLMMLQHKIKLIFNINLLGSFGVHACIHTYCALSNFVDVTHSILRRQRTKYLISWRSRLSVFMDDEVD